MLLKYNHVSYVSVTSVKPLFHLLNLDYEKPRWAGPFSHTWITEGDKSQCEKLEVPDTAAKSLSWCKKTCLSHVGCNAINHMEGHAGDCEILKCPYPPNSPVPPPNKIVGGFKGYCVPRDAETECKHHWTEECNKINLK